MKDMLQKMNQLEAIGFTELTLDEQLQFDGGGFQINAGGNVSVYINIVIGGGCCCTPVVPPTPPTPPTPPCNPRPRC